MNWGAIVEGFLGIMTAFVAAGYIKAELAEIDPNWQPPPSQLQGPLLGDIAPAYHYMKLRQRRAIASFVFFAGTAVFVLGVYRLITLWE